MRMSSGYRSIVEGWQESGAYPVTYIPTVSRPNDPVNAAWDGRTGRVESILGPVLDEHGLHPANSIAYICGNPDMILSAEATLLERGYPEDQVHKELYWPKGKEPRGAGGGGPGRGHRGRRGERRPVGVASRSDKAKSWAGGLKEGAWPDEAANHAASGPSAPGGLEAIQDQPGDTFDRDPLLGHRIAVADRDRAVLERVDVDRHAPRRPDLVLAAIELADRGRVVVDRHRVALQVVLDAMAQLDDLGTLLEQRQDRDLVRRELGWSASDTRVSPRTSSSR